MAVRHLYLARHAEPDADGRLTPRGARQAGLLGRRLAGLPLSSVAHGPLPRATATAALVAAELGGGVPLTELTPPATTSPTFRRPRRSIPTTAPG